MVLLILKPIYSDMFINKKVDPWKSSNFEKDIDRQEVVILHLQYTIPSINFRITNRYSMQKCEELKLIYSCLCQLFIFIFGSVLSSGTVKIFKYIRRKLKEEASIVPLHNIIPSNKFVLPTMKKISSYFCYTTKLHFLKSIIHQRKIGRTSLAF